MVSDVAGVVVVAALAGRVLLADADRSTLQHPHNNNISACPHKRVMGCCRVRS
jgi:hypothetical protein